MSASTLKPEQVQAGGGFPPSAPSHPAAFRADRPEAVRHTTQSSSNPSSNTGHPSLPTSHHSAESHNDPRHHQSKLWDDLTHIKLWNHIPVINTLPTGQRTILGTGLVLLLILSVLGTGVYMLRPAKQTPAEAAAVESKLAMEHGQRAAELAKESVQQKYPAATEKVKGVYDNYVQYATDLKDQAASKLGLHPKTVGERIHDTVKSVKDKLTGHEPTITERAQEAVMDAYAKSKAGDLYQAAKDKLMGHEPTLRERVSDMAQSVKDKLTGHEPTVTERAEQAVHNVRDRLGDSVQGLKDLKDKVMGEEQSQGLKERVGHAYQSVKEKIVGHEPTVAERAQQAIHKAEQAVSDAKDKLMGHEPTLRERVSDMAESVKNKLTGHEPTATEKAERIAHNLRDRLEDSVQGLKDKVAGVTDDLPTLQEAKDSAQEHTQGLRDRLGQAYQSVKDKLSGHETVSEKAQQAIHDAQNAIENGKEKLMGQPTLRERVSDMAQSVKNKLTGHETVSDKVQRSAQELKETAQEKMGDAQEYATQKAQDLKENLKDKVKGATKDMPSIQEMKERAQMKGEEASRYASQKAQGLKDKVMNAADDVPSLQEAKEAAEHHTQGLRERLGNAYQSVKERLLGGHEDEERPASPDTYAQQDEQSRSSEHLESKGDKEKMRLNAHHAVDQLIDAISESGNAEVREVKLQNKGESIGQKIKDTVESVKSKIGLGSEDKKHEL